MKTIVVYYSMGGNTQWAAEQIAAQLGADLLRVEPQKAYPDKGFKKFFWGGKAAVMAETPALDPYEFDASAYERVVFGFPVWAGNVTPPLRTFVKENKAALRDCRKAAFACQSGSGAEKAFEKLKEALGVSSLDAELVLIDPKDRPDAANGQKIADFCAALR
jgi:flavodoxin